MQKIGCLAASIVLALVLLIGVAVGSAAYGYNQLETDFKAQEYSPVVDTGIGSIASAIINIFKGDVLGAAASIIKGVNIDGTLTISNSSFIPLYLPSMKHKVSIEGKESKTIVPTDAMWIAPNSLKHIPFRVTIASDDLPQVAINALAKGGTIDAMIVSEFSLGTFSITRTSHRQESISKSLSSYTGQQSTPPSVVSTLQDPEIPSVDFAGWYVGSSKVSNAEKTDRVTGRISLSEGSATSYKLRIRRDIRFADDITVDELSFDYNGVSTQKEISFVPPVATDEGNTDGYHLDLLHGNSVIWTLADAYPPRLRVTQPTAKYMLSVTVNPPEAGNVSISPPGGTYDSGTVVTLTATPASGYQFDSWSGGVSGTSHTVTISMSTNKDVVASFNRGPLVVNLDGWYVDGTRVSTALKDKQVIARVTLSGGNLGQYTIRLRRDIQSASDETVSEVSFTYDGVAATKELPFNPPYATNEASTDGYHLDLLKDNNVIWTLQDAYPPRLRVTSPIVTYVLRVTVSPSTGGVVNLSPSGGTYASGTLVTLTANPVSGFQFASWSGDISGTSPTFTVTMNSNKNIIANFTAGQLSVSFVGWYVGGTKVNTATKGSSIVARITVSGGSPGQYKMRVRRDIVWADDQTVNELTFTHEGALSTKDLAFVATYATGESSTDGYHIDLVKDGYVVWTLSDAYPPRLRVNP